MSHPDTLHAFLILDIDKFKDVNDTYGHAVGDKVLQRVGEFLKSQFRDGDIIGRIGGAQIIGVPACALFFKTTVFDIILPRMLAGVPITRLDLAKIGNGGLCMECKVCTFPKCPFGKV